jgi:hypothetical protein
LNASSDLWIRKELIESKNIVFVKWLK